MLLTLEQEARRQRVQMPSPERLRKVSMIFRTYHRNVKLHLCCTLSIMSLKLLGLSSQVERSLLRLETVVKERETALRLLQTGQEKGRPGDWRRNIFGYIYWWVSGVSYTECWELNFIPDVGTQFSWCTHRHVTHIPDRNKVSLFPKVFLKVLCCIVIVLSFFTGIDLKSMLSHGTWIKDTRERSSTHPSLWNLTSGEMVAAKCKLTVLSRKSTFSFCMYLVSYRLRIEKHMREKMRKARLEKEQQVKLKARFPQMKVPAS